jgi:peroxiredoxin
MISAAYKKTPRDLARRSACKAMGAAAVLSPGVLLAACNAKPAAPQFSYTLLDGKRGSTADLQGKVVLVNFWATNCASCVKEMPQLVATHQKFVARGLQTLAVSMSYDPPAQVAHFAQSRALPLAVVIDNTGAIARAFGDVKVTPTLVLIDKAGAIVKRVVGEPNFAELHTLVDQLLLQS